MASDDLPPKKWTGLCPSALGLGWADVAQDWRFAADTLVAPPSLAGTSVAGLNSRSLASLPPQEAEVRLLLRRGIWLSRGRWIDIDDVPTAADLQPAGACFSYQPTVARNGRRRPGSERDFSAGTESPLNGRG